MEIFTGIVFIAFVLDVIIMALTLGNKNGWRDYRRLLAFVLLLFSLGLGNIYFLVATASLLAIDFILEEYLRRSV